MLRAAFSLSLSLSCQRRGNKVGNDGLGKIGAFLT